MPTSTPSPSCPKKVLGDANCDGNVDTTDLGIWKSEFVNFFVQLADFNGDGKVNLLDFEIWRNSTLH
jgi:hypothetical protein